MRGGRPATASLAFKRGAAAVAFDVHLEDGGMMNQAVDDCDRHCLVAEHDITPQYQNGCHGESGSLTRPIRSSVSYLRSVPAGRVGGLAGSKWFFRTADIAGSRRKQRILKRQLVRQGRIVICRSCRHAPCFPWRNTCGHGFPPQERGSMKQRAQQLILPLEPALPDRRLILAPRLWPTMTPRAQQQLAKRVAQLLRSVLRTADPSELSGGPQDDHAARFGKSGNNGTSRQVGLHLRAANRPPARSASIRRARSCSTV